MHAQELWLDIWQPLTHCAEEQPDKRPCQAAAREHPASHRARHAVLPRSPSAGGALEHKPLVNAARHTV